MPPKPDAWEEYQALQQIRNVVPHVSDDVAAQVFRAQNCDVQRTIEALLALDGTDDVPLTDTLSNAVGIWLAMSLGC